MFLAIKAGADIERIDGKGRSPLLVACDGDGESQRVIIESASQPAIGELIAAGANAMVTDRSDKNAIHLLLSRLNRCSIGEGDIEGTVSALLEAGCSPWAPDQEGWTPLHLALQTGHFSVAVMFVEAGPI